MNSDFGHVPISNNDVPGTGLYDPNTHKLVAAEAGTVTVDPATNVAYAPMQTNSGSGGNVNIAQFGGVATQMATADGVAQADFPMLVLGLWNSSSGGTIDRLRDVGSLGDGFTIGLIGSGQFLFNGGSWDRHRTPTVFVPIKNVSVTAGSAASIWTPADGKKFHLMGFAVSLSVAGYIIFEDAGTTATEFLRTPQMAAGTGMVSPANMGNGYASTTANNILKMDVSASGTINGFLFGTEEY
jgi:hypothetical protein